MTVALSAVGRQGESLNVFIQYLTLKKKKKKSASVTFVKTTNQRTQWSMVSEYDKD